MQKEVTQTTKREIIEEFLRQLKVFSISGTEVLMMRDVRKALKELPDE